MRLTVIAVLTVLSCAATAAANPIAADIGIDFDPPNYVIETYPSPYSIVNAYVVLYHAQGVGTNWIAFQPSLTPGAGVGTGFTQFVPGPIPIGDWDEGIVVMSNECGMSAFAQRPTSWPPTQTEVRQSMPSKHSSSVSPDVSRGGMNSREYHQRYVSSSRSA